MSTKIYNAYIYKGNIEDLLNDLYKIRQKFIKYCAKQLYLDGSIVNKVVENGDYVNVHYMLVDETKKIARGYFDYVSAGITIYPHKKKLAVLFFFNMNRKIWTKWLNDKFVDYHYQNQTDRDPNITARAWTTRKEFWEDFNVPVLDGLQFELNDWHTLSDIATLYNEKVGK